PRRQPAECRGRVEAPVLIVVTEAERRRERGHELSLHAGAEARAARSQLTTLVEATGERVNAGDAGRHGDRTRGWRLLGRERGRERGASDARGERGRGEWTEHG